MKKIQAFLISKENIIPAIKEMNSGNSHMESRVINVLIHDENKYLVLVESNGYPFIEMRWEKEQFFSR